MPIQTTVRIRGLGGELRQLRERNRMTTRHVAAQLGWQASKVSRVETGKQGIAVEDMASLLVVYGVTGDERRRLLGMAERSREPGWWEIGRGLSKESKTLIQLEVDATRILNFEPLLVPGLLQTPEYTRALMKSGGLSEVDTEARMAGRLGRQAILSRDDPPELRVIVDETVLRRAVGGPRTMARQLRRMAEATEGPHVTLQVLPFALGAHTGLDGSFMVLDFAEHKSVVHIEHKITAQFLEEPEQIDLFRREADRLAALALTPAESADFVERVATEHERE